MALDMERGKSMNKYFLEKKPLAHVFFILKLRRAIIRVQSGMG